MPRDTRGEQTLVLYESLYNHFYIIIKTMLISRSDVLDLVQCNHSSRVNIKIIFWNFHRPLFYFSNKYLEIKYFEKLI